MKRLVVLLFTLSLSVTLSLSYLTASAQIQDFHKLSREQIRLHKIRKITYYHNNFLNGYDIFDTNGNRIEAYFNLSEYTRRISCYDEHNRLIEESDLDECGMVLAYKTVKYNKKGLPVCTLIRDKNNKVVYIDSSRYNKLNLETDFSRYTVGGRLNYGFKYVYDKNGRLDSKTEYNSLHQLEYRTEYKYDICDRVSEETTYDANGAIEEFWRYTYDEAGNQIQSFCMGNCLIDGGYMKKYDPLGRVTEYAEVDSNYTITSITTFKYNKQGNKIESVEKSPQGFLLQKKEFRYNEKGLLKEFLVDEFDSYTAVYEYY